MEGKKMYFQIFHHRSFLLLLLLLFLRVCVAPKIFAVLHEMQQAVKKNKKNKTGLCKLTNDLSVVFGKMIHDFIHLNKLQCGEKKTE